MKLPQTFIPDKDLEGRTEELLEEQKNKKNYFIDLEAGKLFPNFINYLKEEHDILYIQKDLDKKRLIWAIHTKDELGASVRLGMIGAYMEKEGSDLLYGYEVEIKTQGKCQTLIYRVGYKKYDEKRNVITTNEPARYDTENIPFP